MTNQATDKLIALLPEWDRYFSGYVPPTILDAESDIAELRMRLANLRRRLRDGPLAPLRIAFFGPTGSGKSKLFSSLVGQNLSGSGYRRPFTRKACYFLHEDWKSLAVTLDGSVEHHSNPDWRDAVIIDTPDFDSVEDANRAEAERVFLEADGFLFVTDALKYADASTWNYLTRIRHSGKLFSIILNKVNSDEVPASFRERYYDTFPSMNEHEVIPEVVVPEFTLGDDELIAANHDSIRALHEAARRLSADAGPETSAAMFEREGKGIVAGARDLRDRVVTLQDTLEDLRRRNAQRLSDSKQRLEHRLSTGLDPEVRDEVYQRVLTRLEKIDLLRYPRKIISAPIRGLKALVSGWLPGREETKQPVSGESTDPVTSETFHLLESELIRLADEARLDIQNQPGFEELIDRETFQRLKVSHEDAKAQFAKHYEEFTEWLATHAKETASEITSGNKTKFIVSQLLFNTLLITAQVHTGGAFSLFELGMDGVLSPFVAKAVGMAIGNDKVKEFEQEAHDYHQRSLGHILEAANQRVEDYLNESASGLTELHNQLDQIVEHNAAFDELVADFNEQAKIDGKSKGKG